MTTDEIKKETVSWFSDKGNSEQVEFSNKLASVYDVYQKLLGPDAKELLSRQAVMMRHIHGAMLRLKQLKQL